MIKLYTYNSNSNSSRRPLLAGRVISFIALARRCQIHPRLSSRWVIQLRHSPILRSPTQHAVFLRYRSLPSRHRWRRRTTRALSKDFTLVTPSLTLLQLRKHAIFSNNRRTCRLMAWAIWHIWPGSVRRVLLSARQVLWKRPSSNCRSSQTHRQTSFCSGHRARIRRPPRLDCPAPGRAVKHQKTTIPQHRQQQAHGWIWPTLT